MRLLADRFDAYLKGVREARDAADREKDQDTVDLLTGIAEEFEKNAWFLRATLAASMARSGPAPGAQPAWGT